MMKAAEIDRRQPIVWGGITLVVCLLCNMLIPLPYIDIVIGLGISFGVMFALNLTSNRRDT